MALIRISVGPDIQSGPRALTGNWGRARALERANNPLPWRIGTLSDGTLESLDNALMAACRRPDRLGLRNVPDFAGRETMRSDRQPVVLIDADGVAFPASVSDVAVAFGRKGFPIRMNAWRHYLRSELVEKLPGDVLHAFLGHWQRGQEPWSSASCLDPQAYQNALSAPLQALMARDGWQPVQGLGRNKGALRSDLLLVRYSPKSTT